MFSRFLCVSGEQGKIRFYLDAEISHISIQKRSGKLAVFHRSGFIPFRIFNDNRSVFLVYIPEPDLGYFIHSHTSISSQNNSRSHTAVRSLADQLPELIIGKAVCVVLFDPRVREVAFGERLNKYSFVVIHDYANAAVVGSGRIVFILDHSKFTSMP